MDKQSLPRYQVNLKGLIRESRIREIADDSRPARAPYVGIPVVLESGARFCVVVPRRLLEVAIVHAESVRWDADAQRLVLNGGKRSCYQLMTQNAYTVRGQLEAWARGQRKRTMAKSATPGERKAAKFDAEIGKLQRRKAKVYAHRPVNPLCQAPREMAGDWLREREAAWYAGKRVRQELSRVFTGPCLKATQHIARPDWKHVYAEAARVLGLDAIDETRKHSRVTKLTRGPSLTEYMRHPEKHLAFQSKPWRDTESHTFDVEGMRAARKSYLEEMSTIRAIEGQIRNLEELKRAALSPVESETVAA